MSVVAWDGKALAADRQATNAGLRYEASKLRKLATGEVLAFTGDADSVEIMVDWYESGRLREKWPAFQADKDLWVRMIVATASGVMLYERQPIPMRIVDPFMAWGSGRDYAIGAMARGATAQEAVEIAMKFDNGCGLGVDVARFS